MSENSTNVNVTINNSAPVSQLRTNRGLAKFIILSILTLGIGYLVWHHKLCARIGSELTRRGLDCKFGAGDYWGWNILGTLIIVGPFIFCYKLFKAMNTLNADFNLKG